MRLTDWKGREICQNFVPDVDEIIRRRRPNGRGLELSKGKVTFGELCRSRFLDVKGFTLNFFFSFGWCHSSVALMDGKWIRWTTADVFYFWNAPLIFDVPSLNKEPSSCLVEARFWCLTDDTTTVSPVSPAVITLILLTLTFWGIWSTSVFTLTQFVPWHRPSSVFPFDYSGPWKHKFLWSNWFSTRPCCQLFICVSKHWPQVNSLSCISHWFPWQQCLYYFALWHRIQCIHHWL